MAWPVVFSLASFLLSKSLATLALALGDSTALRLGAAFLALNGDRDLDVFRERDEWDGLRIRRDGVRARRSPIPLPPALPCRSSASGPRDA
mmetsp:Transcript_63407/g.151522  ORF Transcript_63407/g.151522 Transcript_63407/m.151522 type:complete len:91 (-) Transcript_63407:5-277(-)